MALAAEKAGKKDVFFCLFFVFFWIIPVIYNGLTQKKISFFPRGLSYFQSISGLFTHSVPVWPMPYIQIRLTGEADWQTLREADFFRLKTFGYRTRFFEALYYGTNIKDYARRSRDTQKELADWIARRYQKLNPQSKRIAAVRFIAGLYFIDPKAQPVAHWENLPLKTFSPEKVYVLSEHTIISDEPVQ